MRDVTSDHFCFGIELGCENCSVLLLFVPTTNVQYRDTPRWKYLLTFAKCEEIQCNQWETIFFFFSSHKEVAVLPLVLGEI